MAEVVGRLLEPDLEEKEHDTKLPARRQEEIRAHRSDERQRPERDARDELTEDRWKAEPGCRVPARASNRDEQGERSEKVCEQFQTIPTESRAANVTRSSHPYSA